jgi:LacI family transcriptional regulator
LTDKEKEMGITIKEIAIICGVSPGTVDRALNNRPGINSKTKHKILHVAKEFNYQPDHTARSLARGKTMTLGVVLFDLHNRSFAQLMNAIESRCRELGYFIDLALTDKNPLNEKVLIERLISRKVDGIILFTVNKGKEFDEYLKGLNIPIVTIWNRLSNSWKYVGINDRQAMKDAVNYVISKGYRKMVYICPPLAYRGRSNIYTQEERLKGCIEGLLEHGIKTEPLIIQEKDYIREIEKIEFSGNEKTAVICSCDYYALEVMNFFKVKGLKIPDDVGLMGFDNIDVLKYVSPSLATVEYAVEDMGIKAVDGLISQIEKDTDDAEIPLLQYKLIPGMSL